MLENHIATIAASATVSTEIPANGLLITGVYIPPGMTSTSITFQGAAQSGGPYFRIGDGNGNAFGKTFAAGDYVPLEPSTFAGVNFLQIVTNATETAQRNLIFSVRAI